MKEILGFLNKFNIPLDAVGSFIENVKQLHYAEKSRQELEQSQELVKFKKQIEIKEKLLKEVLHVNKKLKLKLLKSVNDCRKISFQKQDVLTYGTANNENFQCQANLASTLNVHELAIHNERERLCSLTRWPERCRTKAINMDNFMKELVELQNINQHLENCNEKYLKNIETLSTKYNNLMVAFKDYQKKVLFMNSLMCEKNLTELV